jgi:RNA polymerase sigma-70 factor (ECF subfamily)
MNINQTDDHAMTQKGQSAMMRGVTEGSDQAFAALCDQFRALIYTTVYRVINNPQDAEDLTQDVLLKIWKKADTWDVSKGRLSTWIASIARNRAIDVIRSKQRRAALCERVQNEERAHIGTIFEDPAREKIYATEAHQIARSAIVELSPEQRKVIEMVYIEGLTQVEVAKRVGIPIGTAKARVRRGVQRLRKTVPELINS